MRKIVYLLVGCTVLLLASYAGLRGYKVWKQNHMMTLARHFLAKSDLRNTVLCINQVLQSNPHNIEACRMLADLAEGTRSPSALLWRSRVVELSPKSTDDRLALARTALLMRDLITATNALEGINAAGKETVAYHNTAGLVAVALNEIPEAETQFTQAITLDPTNSAPRLNLAVIHLRSTNSTLVADARTALRDLSTVPGFGPQALRELVADAVRQRQTNEALRLVQQLAEGTNAAFGDRIVRLELLRSTQNPEFQPYLATLQREAVSEPGKIYELVAWQTVTTGPASALGWMVTLPTAVRTNQVVSLMSAQCRAALQDWRGLLVAAEQENWAELEFVRHTFMARAMRGLDLASSAKTEWEQALKGVNNRKEGYVMLLRLAIEWNWASEQEQVLWTLVNQFPSEKWAAAGLAQLLFNGGRTQALLTLFTQISRANPTDVAAKNNLALTALLLGADTLKPHDLAREVYQRAPTNSSVASTYAYSLYVQEKPAEALRIIEQLQPADLEKPTIAAYYGVMLKGTGNPSKARKYLEIASKARLLPEEQRLVTHASGGG